MLIWVFISKSKLYIATRYRLYTYLPFLVLFLLTELSLVYVYSYNHNDLGSYG